MYCVLVYIRIIHDVIVRIQFAIPWRVIMYMKLEIEEQCRVLRDKLFNSLRASDLDICNI